ncbi:MAG TPA: sulfopyruvate decarboxylase subunit alpha [Candidatus Bathyarchaeia archaeon]|nr:sulfopyruvate decarboxylase subunit alpha [Candidatus Bathyarchaeia archaeon]
MEEMRGEADQRHRTGSIRIRSGQIDSAIIAVLETAGINFICSVPCALLSGIIDRISKRNGITHVPVTREEEGIGICAGAFLGGAKPALFMQNSGLGNSINALLSLTKLYHIDLLLVIGYRGRRGEEQIHAQIPMGTATTKLLTIIGAEYMIVTRARDIGSIKPALSSGKGIRVILLTPTVWKKV